MALGMIEVFGFTTSILVADAVAKAGNVTIDQLDTNKPAAGDSAEVPLVMIVKFTGNVSDVEQSLEAGVEVAKDLGMYITSYVITREEEDTKKLIRLSTVGRDKLNFKK